MRAVIFAVLFAALPLSLQAAPTWQVISSEPGKRIELDRTAIKRDEAGKVTAMGRVVLEKEIPDARSGGTYRVIEALTRYDCAARNAATLKRVYKKNETEVLREEELNGGDMPVRAGTLDDKVLREVCRPGGPKGDVQEVAQKANDAAAKLRAANEAMVQQELAKTNRASAIKTSGSPAPVVSAPMVRRAPVREAKPEHHEQHAHAHIHWSYEGEGGPENWAKLDPKNKLCAVGERQSPIDIRDGIRVDLEPIKFDYRPAHFRIVDNGHTVQVALSGSSITLTGKTYELVQFHFHKPSEERVNGRRFDMVAHLVHKADDGQLAVVAVLLERGTENATIQTLWNNLPLESGLTVVPPEASIDLSVFLPTNRNYYTYMGSLTTPPCSEGVLWLVLKPTVQVSPEQIDIFGRLYRNNARPIQPVTGRLIKEGR